MSVCPKTGRLSCFPALGEIDFGKTPETVRFNPYVKPLR
jgi:hypothetical protein